VAAREASDKLALSLAYLPAASGQRRFAFAVAVFQFVACAVVAPFALAVPRIDGFIPFILAIVFLADLITAVLLFNQSLASRALLVLANGYLFSALIVIPHALTFPGAFAPQGLLGAGVQSSGWLNVLWHFGFLAAVAGYAWLKSEERGSDFVQHSALNAFCWSATIQIGLVCALTWAVTAGDRFMPRLFFDDRSMAPLGNYVAGILALMSVLVPAADVDSTNVGARSVGDGCDLHADIRNDAGGVWANAPLLSWMVCQSRPGGRRFNSRFDSSALRVDAVTWGTLTRERDVEA
jgi:hypothetical protein